MNFKLLQELVDELNSSNSTNNKKAALQKDKYQDKFILSAMVATYNPFVKYYVSIWIVG